MTVRKAEAECNEFLIAEDMANNGQTFTIVYDDEFLLKVLRARFLKCDNSQDK